MAEEQNDKFIVRKGLDLDRTEVKGSVAKLFQCEGWSFKEARVSYKLPLIPEPKPNCSLRENYVPNSELFHYPRPFPERVCGPEDLDKIFGTRMITPQILLITYLRRNEVDVGNREPTYEDWLRLTSTGVATYPIMYMRFVLGCPWR